MRLTVQSSWLTEQQTAQLTANRKTGIERINDMIGTVRAKYITVIPGQEMVYLRKESEAQSFILATDPVLTDYAFISSEVGITAATGYEVAQVILNMSNMWTYVGSALESLRMIYSNGINSASSKAAIESLIEDLAEALSAF